MEKQICIVSVIDDYKVVLNVGAKDGVSMGNRFLIYTLSDQQIIDPITQEPLGFLEYVKGTGTVTHIQDTMCTIESDKYENSHPRKVIRRNSSYAVLNPLGGSTEETIIEKEHIPFDDPQIMDLAKRI